VLFEPGTCHGETARVAVGGQTTAILGAQGHSVWAIGRRLA
jgi:hypothetical protein